MTKKLNKRGFTIVELVVVIVVIAILAAVLIPTISSLVDKANRSADIQAVHQMNTQLAINEVTEGKSIVDVYNALEEGGMTAKDYHPLAKDTYFFWVQDDNRIVYVDDDYNILYPNEYEGKKIDNLNQTYLALGGDIKQVEAQLSEDKTTATVTSAEQLYWLSENIDSKASTVKEIKLAVDKIDLKGAEIAIVAEKDREIKITGVEDGTTVTGLVSLNSKCVDSGKRYASGFVAYVNEGASLDISNIIIDGATIGGYEIGGVGGLIGRIEQGAGKVKVSNCSVINSTINGKNKVGALIGSIGAAKVEIENCKVDSCIVNCSEGESGKAIGCVYNADLNLTIKENFEQWCTNTTLNLVETANRNIVDVSVGDIFKCESKATDVKIPEGYQKLVRKLDDNGKKEFLGNLECYRMFANDAYMTILMNNDSAQVAIGNDTTISVVNLAGNNAERKLEGKDIDVNILWFVK